MTTDDPGFAPHLAALRRCVTVGFQFMELPDAVYGFRERMGAVDVLLVCDIADARAARYGGEELSKGRPVPIWSSDGTVVDVVADLLTLPPHGSPGAPALASVRRDLWLPR